MKINHEGLVRPEGILSNLEDDALNWAYYDLWLPVLRACCTKECPSSVTFFKRVLGPQAKCVVFNHRNWVWTNQEEGWVLYVDKRGPSVCVPEGSTPEATLEAVRKLVARVLPPVGVSK